MPGIDGVEATRKIRGIDSRVPIIAVTASAQSTEHERYRVAGMNGVIAKPATASMLTRVLEKAEAEKRGRCARVTCRFATMLSPAFAAATDAPRALPQRQRDLQVVRANLEDAFVELAHGLPPLTGGLTELDDVSGRLVSESSNSSLSSSLGTAVRAVSELHSIVMASNEQQRHMLRVVRESNETTAPVKALSEQQKTSTAFATMVDSSTDLARSSRRFEDILTYLRNIHVLLRIEASRLVCLAHDLPQQVSQTLTALTELWKHVRHAVIANYRKGYDLIPELTLAIQDLNARFRTKWRSPVRSSDPCAPPCRCSVTWPTPGAMRLPCWHRAASRCHRSARNTSESIESSQSSPTSRWRAMWDNSRASPAMSPAS
jgi:hypothetical protein